MITGRSLECTTLYYVYGWYMNDLLVYVGKGCEGRAWRDFTAEYKLMLLIPGFHVKILRIFRSRIEAFRDENRRIRKYKPALNLIRASKLTKVAVTFHLPFETVQDLRRRAGRRSLSKFVVKALMAVPEIRGYAEEAGK